MQRFQLDRAIMVRRWRREWEAHGRNFGACHCALGIGTMRKHRPYESHASNSCRLCMWERVLARQGRRRRRYAARVEIVESLRMEGARDSAASNGLAAARPAI